MHVTTVLLTVLAPFEDVAGCTMLHMAATAHSRQPLPVSGAPHVHVAACESPTAPNSAGREQLARVKCSRHEVRAMHQGRSPVRRCRAN